VTVCGLPVGDRPRVVDSSFPRCSKCSDRLGVAATEPAKLRQERAQMIAKMVADGYTSKQCSAKLGISADTVTAIIRDFGIKRAKLAPVAKLNHENAIEKTVSDYEAAAHSIKMLSLNPHGVASETLEEWLRSMDGSARVFRWLRDRISS